MTEKPPLPNFLYIGTSKAGSTWIYDVLNRHPEIHMAPGKGLYFFSRHWDRGLAWYAEHFAAAAGEKVVGEVSHAYLYAEQAPDRIFGALPDVRLMACLREPAERAFSDYLDGVKNGKLEGTFESALEKDPEIFDRGCYARFLAPYLERGTRARLHVAIFDDLVATPDEFAAELFRFLGVAARPLTAAQHQRMLPAGVPRSTGLATLAKRGARLLHRAGLRGLRGRLKTSRMVRNVLYRPLAREERPTLDPQTNQRLRERYAPEVAALDALLGTQLARRWGYEA